MARGKTQKVLFSHPLYDTFLEKDIPVDMTFKEITKLLIDDGFIEEKKGGYHYLFEDNMCMLGEKLSTYIPEGLDCMEIRIHGLLVVLT